MVVVVAAGVFVLIHRVEFPLLLNGIHLKEQSKVFSKNINHIAAVFNTIINTQNIVSKRNEMKQKKKKKTALHSFLYSKIYA